MTTGRGPVALLMVDGLRPDALGECDCPALQGLLARSAASLQATAVVPSRTLACHLSLFHSVSPERHGVVWNQDRPQDSGAPALVDLAHAAGLRSAAVFNWGPLRQIGGPESWQASLFRDTLLHRDGDEWVADAAIDLLAQERVDFAFVYFGTVDVVGHAEQFMSDAYLRQVERVDGCLARLLRALPPSAHVLLQADHGGHEWDHGTDLPEDLLIPWMLSGPAARAGHRLDGPVSLLDSAPTLARLLGLDPHPAWEGRCVEDALAESGASPAASGY